MVKRTILVENKATINARNLQLQIKTEEREAQIPIEDIGFLVIDNSEVQISITALNLLVENNTATIICGKNHLPNGMFLNLNSHHIQQEIFKNQINASEPLKKNLWQQTVREKILNQGILLEKINGKKNHFPFLAEKVKSGDSTNMEGVAAAEFWRNLPLSPSKGVGYESIKRERFGEYPNNFLNYGYAILRAATARALSGSGLLNTLGIHHKSKYNAFALADDIMEPFRPMIDEKVYQLTQIYQEQELNTFLKKELVSVLTQTVYFEEIKSPLMVALQKVASSLQQCYTGKRRKINYPKLWN